MEARRGARTRAFVRRCIGKLNLPVILVLVVYAYVYTLVYMDNKLVYMDIRNKLDVDI